MVWLSGNRAPGLLQYGVAVVFRYRNPRFVGSSALSPAEMTKMCAVAGCTILTIPALAAAADLEGHAVMACARLCLLLHRLRLSLRCLRRRRAHFCFHRRPAPFHATLPFQASRSATQGGIMGAQSSTGKAYISSEVVKAVISANLPHNHPMRQELEANAEIVGDDRNLFVRVPDGRGGKAILA